MFGKKKEQPEVRKVKIDTEDDKGYETKKTQVNFTEGIRTVKDILAPSGISVLDPKTLMVGERYVRTYVMQGYPKSSYVGWLNNLYNYRGEMDVTVKFEPSDDRAAVDSLTKQIAGYQSQLEIEQEKGSIRNISKYQNMIYDLERQRTLIEQNLTSLLECTITANLMSNSQEKLDHSGAILENTIKGQRMEFIPAMLRMADAYKATLPSIPDTFKDKKRNFDVTAATGCFPFYGDEISDPDGVFLGYNLTTGTPAMLDVFDKKVVSNTNMSVFGMAGSGKSYSVSLLTLRSATKGVRTAIIDPEGEYHNVTDALGGKTVEIGAKSSEGGATINIFDVDEEEEIDDNGNLTGRVIVNLKEKISDILGVLGVMAPNIDKSQESALAEVLQRLYRSFGITNDPKSLYTSDQFDEKTGEFHRSGIKKTMPTFSDFHDMMIQSVDEYPELANLVRQLKIYRKGGIYDMFDCQSSIRISDFKNLPVINFDVKKLDSSAASLRPIGMYIALTFVWDKFVKRNPGVKKRVIVDEAWMFLNQNMAGHQFTAAFLETLARRIRKRKAGLLVASQNFSEFLQCPEGQSVVKNSPYTFFLKQSETDLDNLQDIFRLTEGERRFVTNAGVGMMLLKTERGSCTLKSYAFPFEHEILTKKKF